MSTSRRRLLRHRSAPDVALSRDEDDIARNGCPSPLPSSPLLFRARPRSAVVLAAVVAMTGLVFRPDCCGVSGFGGAPSLGRMGKYKVHPCTSVRGPTPSWLPALRSSAETDPETTGMDGNGEEDEDEVEVFYSPNAAFGSVGDVDGSSSSGGGSSGPSAAGEYSFFDEAIVYVRAGSGGQGSSTFKKGVRNQDGPPDGGNGGKGGDIVIEADPSLNTLAGLTRFAWRPNSFGGGGAAKKRGGGGGGFAPRPLSFRAENGDDGARQFRSGRTGKGVIVRVPPGTIVQEEILLDDVDDDDDDADDYLNTGADTVTNEDGKQYVDIGTITRDNPKIIVALGGDGGEGSASGGKAGGRGVRRPRVPPVGGERLRLKLTLRIVADVALVAVPNAGKSTLLSSVTRAKPKIADYPFTTVVPNLGVWIPTSYGDEVTDLDGGGGSAGLVMCDVPGLIAGAAEGTGLGHAFLRHVERCRVIVHIVDATSTDPVGDFKMINRELVRYGTGKLAEMPQIVAVNKIDIAFADGGEEWERGLKTRYANREDLEKEMREAMPHSRLVFISAKEKEGVEDLMERLSGFVRKVKETENEIERKAANAAKAKADAYAAEMEAEEEGLYMEDAEEDELYME